MEESLSLGKVKIHNEVVGTIASVAAMEIEGVVSMSRGLVSGLTELLGKKDLDRGIKVQIKGKEAVLVLNIIIKYGAKIPQVSYQIQENVKKTVEKMTGLTVTDVSVHIQGIEMSKKNQKGVKNEKIVGHI